MLVRTPVYILVFIVCLCSLNPLLASNNNYPIGAKASAMGNASSTFTNVFSNFHNQAGLAFIEGTSAGIAYKNNFLLRETGLKAIAVAHPIKNIGTIGVNVSSFGFSNYAENKFGVAFAKKFGKKLALGLNLDYLHNRFIEPYGSKGVILGQFGLLSKVSDQLTIGAHIYNPTRSSLDKDLNDRVPTVIKTGLNYKFNPRLTTVLEVEKDLLLKMNVKAGIEFKAHELLDIRIGVNSANTKIAFGTGINLDHWKIELAAAYHNLLGFTPNMAIRWEFNTHE